MISTDNTHFGRYCKKLRSKYMHKRLISPDSRPASWVFAPAGGSTSGGKDGAELPDSRYEPLAQQCLDLLISKKLP